MGCPLSKDIRPAKPERAKLYGSNTTTPHERYLADPPPHTFDAYARRGIIRASALFPEGVESRRTKQNPQKKRVGGYEKYTRE